MNLIKSNVLLLCLSIISQVCIAENTWIRINSPVTANLFNCVFADTINGWAAGEDGVIIHTTDGGYYWTIQSNPVNYYINDIFFINKRLGWAVSNEFLNTGSTLLKTTNSGINWIAEDFPDSTVFLKTIYFLDSLTGFISGLGGNFFKTTNAGITWNRMFTDTSAFSSFPVVKIRFLTPDTGFACGGIIDIAGVIWKTVNGGLNWSADTYSPEPFYSLYLKSSTDLFAVGGDFEYGAQIVRSSNIGSSWNYFNLGFFGHCLSIDFRTSYEVWMPLGFSQTWAVSYDGGNNWTTEQVTDNLLMNSVDFSDSLHGCAVGNNGVILKYAGNPSSIEAPDNFVPQNAFLNQNYPNPFNPSTRISYGFKGNKFVEIKIFDVLGNEITSLVNRIQFSENTTSLFYADFPAEEFKLSAGVYFYALYLDNEVRDIKKMVYLK